MKEFTKNFEDVKDIVNDLTIWDLGAICNPYKGFKDSPYVLYREVMIIDGEPSAFVDVYQFPGDNVNQIVIACKSKFRNHGYTSELINRMVESVPDRNALVWHTTKDNIASQTIAKKYGIRLKIK